jgi:hypothetical protein
MKNGTKKVVKHLKEDIHEAKESIREDKKLKKALTSKVKKKKK